MLFLGWSGEEGGEEGVETSTLVELSSLTCRAQDVALCAIPSLPYVGGW